MSSILQLLAAEPHAPEFEHPLKGSHESNSLQFPVGIACFKIIGTEFDRPRSQASSAKCFRKLGSSIFRYMADS